MKKDFQKLINFLQTAEQLKKTVRFLGERKIVRESTADHTWQLVLMVFILFEELELKIDLVKALKLALIHDLPEALTGDIDYRYIYDGKIKKEDKEAAEEKAMKKIIKTLPAKTGKEIGRLWADYSEQKSPEARFVNALDKMESISHQMKIGWRGFAGDHPERIPNYADKAVAAFPELAGFLAQLKKELKKEYNKGKVEWKKEYEELDGVKIQSA